MDLPTPTNRQKTLNDLPSELLDQICDNLPQSDKLRLSKTSYSMRDSALPKLFESVTINTRDGSAAASFIGAAAHDDWGKRVRELRVIVPPETCPDTPCLKCTDAQVAHWEEEKDCELLRGDHDDLLPNLRKIIIELPSDFGGHRPMFWYPGCSDAHSDDVELWEWIEHRVVDDLLCVLGALADRGAASNVKELVIVNFAYSPVLCGHDEYETPYFLENPGWKALLGSLERFDLSLWAGDEVRTQGPFWGWRQNYEQSDYNLFLDNLAGIFFDHLSSVKHLRLEGSRMAAIGAAAFDDTSSGRLPLVGEDSPTDTLPALESLTLVKVGVTQSLLDFVQARADRARLTLSLEDTWAYGDSHFDPILGEQYKTPTWVKFLDGLRGLISLEDGPRLRKLEITPRQTPELVARSGLSRLPLRNTYFCINYANQPVPNQVFAYMYSAPFQWATDNDDAVGAFATREKDEESEALLLDAIAQSNT